MNLKTSQVCLIRVRAKLCRNGPDLRIPGVGYKKIAKTLKLGCSTMAKTIQRKKFAENKHTKDMDYWNHVLWSDETKINLFGSDGVKCVWWQPQKSTKTSVSCLQSSMVVVVSWSGAWVLSALGSYSSLRESWMPTCTVTYWSRAWSPPFGDMAAGHYSSITTPTHLQDDHCLAK